MLAEDYSSFMKRKLQKTLEPLTTLKTFHLFLVSFKNNLVFII